MKITRIVQQAKRKDRYSIYVDDQYSFSLSESDLVLQGLSKGQEITAAQIEGMQQVSTTGKAYDKALNYLSIRPRSRHEIEQYLRRKKYRTDIIASVIARLEKLDLINDAVFARSWVEWRQAASPRSRRKLIAELRQKRVDNDIIDQTMGGIDSEIELENLRRLIEKKSHRYSDERRLMAYLAGQGYSYDLIRQALDERDN